MITKRLHKGISLLLLLLTSLITQPLQLPHNHNYIGTIWCKYFGIKNKKYGFTLLLVVIVIETSYIL